MSEQRDNRSAPTSDVRRMLGRGPMQPGKIEKAKDTRRALTRLTLYLSPY